MVSYISGELKEKVEKYFYEKKSPICAMTANRNKIKVRKCMEKKGRHFPFLTEIFHMMKNKHDSTSSALN